MTMPKQPEAGVRMQRMLPQIMRQGTIIQSLLDSPGSEIDRLRAWITDALNQFFLDSMTWGLDRLEEEVGWPAATGLSYPERRARIIARFRARARPTSHNMHAAALAYGAGIGDIDLIVDPERYHLIVRFTGLIGRPAYWEDLEQVMWQMAPANLGIAFEFVYNTWGDVRLTGLLWCQATTAGITWEDIKSLQRADFPTDIECPPDTAPPQFLSLSADNSGGGYGVDFFVRTDVAVTGYIEVGVTAGVYDDQYPFDNQPNTGCRVTVAFGEAGRRYWRAVVTGTTAPNNVQATSAEQSVTPIA